MARLKPVFYPFRPSLLFFSISHRIFRLTLVPLCPQKAHSAEAAVGSLLLYYFAVMKVAALLRFSRYLCGIQSVLSGNGHTVRRPEYA